MPKKNRLSRADFILLEGRSARRCSGKHLSITAHPLPHGHHGPKFAIVISKKNVPRATKRNLVRRRCNTILRAHQKSANRGLAYVIHIKKSAAQAPASDIREDIERLLSESAKKVQ